MISNIFEGVSRGSIDYSPYQPASTVTIILEEDELANATDSQYERFWRVWYKERNFYAPKLQTLILGLCRSTESWKGIHRFLNYFECDVYSLVPRAGLQIYCIDEKQPRTLISIAPAHKSP
jgi:hypothetical protein